MLNYDFSDNSNKDCFVNHLRKIFTITDDERYSEYIIMPTIGLYKNEGHLDREDVWRENLKNYFKTVNHHYLKNLDIKKFNKINDNSQKIVDSATKSSKSFKFSLSNDVEPSPRIKSFESGVSKLLQSMMDTENSFKKYLQFDGHKDLDECQTFAILMPDKSMCSISIFKTAKISDLIGLTCCKYVQERREPRLRHNDVWKYSLAITDENDYKLDNDFPTLDSHKFIHFYGFKLLTLVENEKQI